MKHTLYVLFLTSLLLMACSDDDSDKPFTMSRPPIGETFESATTSITFESEDSIRFHFLTRPSEPEDKAKYIFDNGKLLIINPFGKYVPKDQATRAYFLYFEGGFTSKDKLVATGYEVLARYEHFITGGPDEWNRVEKNP